MIKKVFSYVFFCCTSLSGFLFILLTISIPNVLAAEQEPQTEIQKKNEMIQAVKLPTSDEFILAGDYFLPELTGKAAKRNKSKGAGVLILHDCSHNSKDYKLLGEMLAKQGIHTLALDFRGYGASSSPVFSHEKIKLQSKNIIEYQGAVAGLTSYWEGDVLTAYQFLKQKTDKKHSIAVFSSGCSSVYAVALAEKMHLNAIVMITPQMNYAEKERYKNLIDIPTYFINASHHTQTIDTSKELFEWNGSRSSKIQVFKSDSHDYSLLRRNKYLAEDIVFWLKSNLSH
jgi:alpha/beta superfamily hydrolase